MLSYAEQVQIQTMKKHMHRGHPGQHVSKQKIQVGGRGVGGGRGGWWGAGIARLVVWCADFCEMQHLGFNSPLSCQIEGIFPSELTLIRTPLPKSVSDESLN